MYLLFGSFYKLIWIIFAQQIMSSFNTNYRLFLYNNAWLWKQQLVKAKSNAPIRGMLKINLEAVEIF